MKKRVQILVLLLAMLQLVPLVGCSETPATNDDSPADTNAVAAETAAETVAEEPTWQMFDNLPEKSYDGRTFTILSREQEGNSYADDLIREEYNGEAYNDAIYERNLTVAGRYDVKFEAPTISSHWDHRGQYITTIESGIQANDGAYDLIDIIMYNAGTLIMDGCLLDLQKIPYITPSEVWWAPSSVDNLSVDGRVFITLGELSMNVYGGIFSMFWNKSVFTDYNLGDPYEMVNEGTWTYDALLKIGENCLTDENGDGKYNVKDTFGVVLSNDLEFNNFHNAFQIPITVKNAEGTMEYNLGSEAVADLTNTMQQLASGTTGVLYTKGDRSSKTTMFMDNRAALIADNLKFSTQARDMESEFGVLPFPKKDETQEGYYTTVEDAITVFGIPIDVKDQEFAGLISEALCQASYQIVKPVYYETMLKTKNARDEETGKMIDLLRDGIILDPGAVYAVQLDRAGFLVRDCVYYGHEYSSYYQSKTKAWEKKLMVFLTKIEENNAGR